MTKAERIEKEIIKDCHNTTTIFDTRKYVLLEDYERLQQQLKEKDEEIKRLEGLLIEDEKIMTSDSAELKSAQELNRELVEGLKYALESLNDFDYKSDNYIESLINKANV